MEQAITQTKSADLQPVINSRDKITGMFLGVALGDALGCAVESKNSEEIKETYGRISGFVPAIKGNIHGISGGNYSDDTQLSIAVLEAIIASHGFDINAVSDAHVKAMRENSQGWGWSTKEAVEKLAAGESWEHSGESVIDGRGTGNGVAMKIAPLAALIHESNVDEETKVGIITSFTKLTHSNSLALASAMVQCEALLYCLKSSPENFVREDFCRIAQEAAIKSEDGIPLSRSAKPLIERLNLLSQAKNMSDEEITSACDGGTCYIPNSIPQTLLLFLRSYENVSPLFDAINAGGDTDTNASMAGALLGALHGESIFPAGLLDQVKDMPLIRKAAEEFCNKFGVN